MTGHPWRVATATLLAITTSVACRSGPPSTPGEPMLEAIRAEESEGDLSYVESQGQHLFGRYCVTCHGDEGKGDGQNASNLNPPPPDLTVPNDSRDAAFISKVISEGSASVGRSPLSPPWGRSLSGQQVDYLVAYCQAIARKKKPVVPHQ